MADAIVNQPRIVIKGAGEMATGVVARLYAAGFRRILCLEVDRPFAVRRAVSFCEAVYDQEQQVEGITAVRLESPDDIGKIWTMGKIPVAVDPDWSLIPALKPDVVVDAIIAKKNLGTTLTEAPLVVALGPGFTAGEDAHYVIETNRGHNLGRVLSTGQAEPNTGIPGTIAGYTAERVLRAPIAGTVTDCLPIGSSVDAGTTVCFVDSIPVPARLAGILRGIIRPGAVVPKNLKLGDVDPRGVLAYCTTISEKARALGGAVLECVCRHDRAGRTAHGS